MKEEQAKPVFSVWMRWPTHWEHCGIRSPGVHLLGRFEHDAPGEVDAISPSVIYVGETCSQTLEAGLYQFSRSAFRRKEGHSGGWTFCDTFNGGKPADPPDWLFVSLLPVTMAEPKRSAWIRLVERRILWDFVCKWDRLPQCNGK